jgi:hypothetical protein
LKWIVRTLLFCKGIGAIIIMIFHSSKSTLIDMNQMIITWMIPFGNQHSWPLPTSGPDSIQQLTPECGLRAIWDISSVLMWRLR